MKAMSWASYSKSIYDPTGEIILVQDSDKALPVLWKMPGGQKSAKEIHPVETVDRELKEELEDSEVTVKNPDPIFKEYIPEPRPHMFYVFESVCYKDPKPGMEILKVGKFRKEEIMNLINEGMVVPKHAEALKKILGT